MPPSPRAPITYNARSLMADVQAIAALKDRPIWAASLRRGHSDYWAKWRPHEQAQVYDLMQYWKKFPPARLPASDWVTIHGEATNPNKCALRRRHLAEVAEQEAQQRAEADRESTSPHPDSHQHQHQLPIRLHHETSPPPADKKEGEEEEAEGSHSLELPLRELARWHRRMTPRQGGFYGCAQSTRNPSSPTLAPPSHPLTFPLSPSTLPSLTARQLALAHLHPDYDDRLADKVSREWFRRRERARNRLSRVTASAAAGEGVDEEDDRFALVPLDFPLDADSLALDGALSDEQLLVVQFHPEAGEVEVLKAERTLRKRRERAAALAEAEEKKRREEEESERARNAAAVETTTGEEEDLKPNLAHWVKLQREKVGASNGGGLRLPTPATSATSAVAGTPPLPPTSTSFPPPAQPADTPSRSKKRPRTPSPLVELPPLPDRYEELPSAASCLFHPLRLSNLPTAEISSRSDLSLRLFPPSLQPDARVLYKPDEFTGGLSRQAMVGFFDPEKRIEAMQHCVQVRLGRWDVKAELVDFEEEEAARGRKSRWEWADVADEEVKMRFWREECERVRRAQRGEVEGVAEEEESAGKGVHDVQEGGGYELEYGDEEEEEDDGSLLVPPEDYSPILQEEELHPPPAVPEEAGTPPRPPPARLASTKPSPAPSYASAISLTAPSFSAMTSPRQIRSRQATRDSSPAREKEDVIVLDDDLPPHLAPSSRPPSRPSSTHPSPAPVPAPPTGPSHRSRSRSRPTPSRHPSSSSSTIFSPSFASTPIGVAHSKAHNQSPRPTLLARTTAIEVHGVAGGNGGGGTPSSSFAPENGAGSPPVAPGQGKKAQKRAAAITRAEGKAAGVGVGAGADDGEGRGGDKGGSLLERLAGGDSSGIGLAVRVDEGEGPARKKQKKVNSKAGSPASSSASPAPPSAPSQRGGHAASRGRGRGRGAGPGPAFHPTSAASSANSSSSSSLTPVHFPPPSSSAPTKGKGKGPPPAFLPSAPSPKHPLPPPPPKQNNHPHSSGGAAAHGGSGRGRGKGEERGRGRGRGGAAATAGDGAGKGSSALPAPSAVGRTAQNGAADGPRLADRIGDARGPAPGPAKPFGGGGDLLSRLGGTR